MQIVYCQTLSAVEAFAKLGQIRLCEVLDKRAGLLLAIVDGRSFFILSRHLSLLWLLAQSLCDLKRVRHLQILALSNVSRDRQSVLVILFGRLNLFRFPHKLAYGT